MPAKKLKKFCRITKFLEQTDKDLYQAMDDLCLFGLFRIRGRGITFLYPTDKAYRKKIIDMAYSNTPEKAVDMLRVLVLYDYLPEPTDFKNKKDDIPNAMNLKLKVDSADSKEVKLESGHKLVKDKTFATLREGEPVAVYQLSGKGELPTTGTKATMKYNNTRNGKVKGGDCSLGCAGGNADEIKKLTECVESTYAMSISGGTDTKHNADIYKTVMSLFYSYVAEKGSEDLKMKVYDRLCASARASFYNILSYWNRDSDLSIYDAAVESGIVKMAECDTNTVFELISKHGKTYFDSLGALISACGKSDVASELSARDAKREGLLKSITSASVARADVMAAYEDNAQKLHKDLLTVYCYLAAINEEYDKNYFSTTFTYAMKHIFNHDRSFNEMAHNVAYNLCIYYNLVKSDAFMYVPIADAGKLSDNYNDLGKTLPDPNDMTSFTIQFSEILAKRGGGYGDEDDDTYFGGVMRSL
jgi:hypothetical protein